MNKNQIKENLDKLSEQGWLEKNMATNIPKYETTKKTRRFIADMVIDMMHTNKFAFTFDGQKELESWVRTGNKTKNISDMINLLIEDTKEDL